MRQKLISLIDKYEKKLSLPVDKSTQEYYRGKINAYEHSLILLEAHLSIDTMFKSKEVV